VATDHPCWREHRSCRSAGVGYEVGRKVGQPIGGVMIGGMAGRLLERKRSAGRHAPSLNVKRSATTIRFHDARADMRTILEAKEGVRTPGNADTMIRRGWRVDQGTADSATGSARAVLKGEGI